MGTEKNMEQLSKFCVYGLLKAIELRQGLGIKVLLTVFAELLCERFECMEI